MLKVEQWPIEKLIPYARNPRKNDEQVDKMCAAIREFGFRIPVVAKSDGTVVDGHLRLKAAKKLGFEEIPVALADELSSVQIKAFRLLANQSANWADWDNELLKLEIEELKDNDFNIDMLGFETELLTSLDVEEKESVISGDSDKYTAKIQTPVYEPTGKDVFLSDLYDKDKVDSLVQIINNSSISEEEKAFLVLAAYRHVVFNYENIAEYYASASEEMQRLMEQSALVIIDFESAIEKGFVELNERIDILCKKAIKEAGKNEA